MSVEAISWAFNHAPVDQPSVKFVLVGLANNADSEGIGSFPSIPKLMQYTGLSKRTVQDALDVLEAAKIIAPCDPAIVAARIKRADHRPQGWDIDMTRTMGDGVSVGVFQEAYKELQAKRKRQAEAARARKETANGTPGDNSGGVQPLTPVETDATGVNGDAHGGQPLHARGLTIAAPLIRNEPSLNRPGTVQREDHPGEPDPAAPADRPLAPLASPVDLAALEADIADELSQRTGLDVTPAHTGWARDTLLGQMPDGIGNVALWVRGQIRAADDVRQFLPPDLAAAYAARQHRPKAPAQQAKPKRPAKVPLPDDFAITEAQRRWAAATYPAVDVDHETAKFCNHQRAHGNEAVNWYEAWQKWIRQAHEFAGRQQRATAPASFPRPTGRSAEVARPGASGRLATAADRRLAGNLDAIAWAAEQDRLEAERKGHHL